MTPGESIVIQKVGNGFIVRANKSFDNSGLVPIGDVLVFHYLRIGDENKGSDAETLLEFVNRHFS